MKSIDFPGAFLKIGAAQDEYNTVHALPVEGSPEGEVIAIYELTDEEIQQIVHTKKLFYSRWTFGHKFQPFRISTTPIQFNARLIFEGNGIEPVDVVAEVGPDGVQIQGYEKTEDGRFVKK